VVLSLAANCVGSWGRGRAPPASPIVEHVDRPRARDDAFRCAVLEDALRFVFFLPYFDTDRLGRRLGLCFNRELNSHDRRVHGDSSPILWL